MTTPKKLCQWPLLTLEAALTLDSGESIPVGTEILLVPQTTASSVHMGNGTTLAEVWPALSAGLTDYAAELVRYADRLTTVEAKCERLTAWATHNGYTGE